MRGARHVSPDARGAVFLEKLIAYAPLISLFFLGFQLAEVSAAQLVVGRATSAAARAAMVVMPDDPVFYHGEETHRFEGARKDDVYLAAAMVLSAAPQLGGTFEVQVSDPPVADFGPLDVTVHATYHCGGVTLLCGIDKTIALRSTTTVAYHRAQYAYELLPDAGGVVLGGRSEALGNQNRSPAAGNPGTGANTTGGGGAGPSESSPPAQDGQTCKCPPWSQRINTSYANAFSGWDWREDGIRGELRQGVVGFSIRKGPCTPSGGVMFNRMMDHFARPRRSWASGPRGTRYTKTISEVTGRRATRVFRQKLRPPQPSPGKCRRAGGSPAFGFSRRRGTRSPLHFRTPPLARSARSDLGGRSK